jgi:hypothetical protein
MNHFEPLKIFSPGKHSSSLGRGQGGEVVKIVDVVNHWM